MLTDLLANRRIPGEIRKTLRPTLEPPDAAVLSSFFYANEEITIDEVLFSFVLFFFFNLKRVN